jgi:hypothetical protein
VDPPKLWSKAFNALISVSFITLTCSSTSVRSAFCRKACNTSTGVSTSVGSASGDGDTLCAPPSVGPSSSIETVVSSGSDGDSRGSTMTEDRGDTFSFSYSPFSSAGASGRTRAVPSRDSGACAGDRRERGGTNADLAVVVVIVGFRGDGWTAAIRALAAPAGEPLVLAP